MKKGIFTKFYDDRSSFKLKKHKEFNLEIKISFFSFVACYKYQKNYIKILIKSKSII